MQKKQVVTLVVAGVIAMALGIVTGYFVKKWNLGNIDENVQVEKKVGDGNVARPDTLPAFTLYDLDGNAVTKEQLLAQDKALLINFWATWCKPCREEMPLLTEMQEKHKDDLVIVGIAIDNQQAVKDFLEYLGGVNYPILLGKQELDAIETANAMGVDLIGLPISLTTDASGNIMEIHTGEVDEAEATALIENAIR